MSPQVLLRDQFLAKGKNHFITGNRLLQPFIELIEVRIGKTLRHCPPEMMQSALPWHIISAGSDVGGRILQKRPCFGLIRIGELLIIPRLHPAWNLLEVIAAGSKSAIVEPECFPCS